MNTEEMATPQLSWISICHAAAGNVWIRAALELMDKSKMTREETLMLMVLWQDDALRNIEKIQADGWKYGE